MSAEDCQDIITIEPSFTFFFWGGVTFLFIISFYLYCPVKYVEQILLLLISEMRKLKYKS